MAKSPMPIDFPNADSRDKWITENATYFTVVMRRNLKTKRIEASNLRLAEQVAAKLVEENPEWRLLIYAVYDPTGDSPLSAYVKTIGRREASRAKLA